MKSAPNPLIKALLAIAAAVTLALCWFGWRLWTQERAVNRERQRERVESGAEAMASGVRGRWAQAGEALSRWVSDSDATPPSVAGAVVLTIAGNRPEVSPRDGLAFVPLVPIESEVTAIFGEAEAAEYGSDGMGRAETIYRGYTRHANARIRAESLMRLARVLLKSGDRAGSRLAYESLIRMEGVLAAGLPAELVGLDGLRRLGQAGCEERIASGLAGGKWLLEKGPAEYYSELVGRPATADSWVAAEAMATLWRERGGPVRDIQGKTWIGMSRGNNKRWAGLVAIPARIFDIKAPSGVRFQLTDASGRLLAGVAGQPRQSVIQVLGYAGSPWVLKVWQDAEEPGGQATIPALVGLVIVPLWGAVSLMIRAIRRESEVLRLQSDFLAAVSHEFRSPLTTVRQLSEMLEMGQVPSEERRQKYYRVLAAEAHRLQRLVEGLLRFGRMEAGAQEYRMEQVDAGELVRRAVQEVEPGDGRIDVSESGAAQVNGDLEALTAAVRNLLENALKYSPADSRVTVGWRRGPGQVFLFVKDRGPGIPAEEQKSVFEKFVRGRRALQESIKGAGVGLSMVKHILAAHGGEVRLESESGKGCTFTLVLPGEGH